MASNPESGHSKNVANFNTLIAFIVTYGTAYNPSKSSIFLTALQTVSRNASDSIDSVNEAFSAYNSAVAARKVAFNPFSKLITRVFNALKSTDTPQEVDDQVKTVVHKLQGTRATPKKTEEEKLKLAAKGKVVNEISASQLSFDNRLANFEKLITLLAGIPLYAPNEQDLTITALINRYNDMKVLNDNAVSALTQLNKARIARNKILYAESVGLTDLALAAKNYIKSLYGSDGPQYRQIGGLEFVPFK